MRIHWPEAFPVLRKSLSIFAFTYCLVAQKPSVIQLVTTVRATAIPTVPLSLRAIQVIEHTDLRCRLSASPAPDIQEIRRE